jgi:transposase-like protein
MNKLTTHKRVKILSALVEGMSMRSVSRLEDVSINTVSKLLIEAGEACAVYHMMNMPLTSPPSTSSAIKYGHSATPKQERT